MSKGLVPALDLRPKADWRLAARDAPSDAERAADNAIASAALDAEHAMLGCALFDREAIESAEDLRPDHFLEPTHGRIWSVICDMARNGRYGDPIAVWNKLETDPGLIEFGGVRFLADLVDRAPPAVYARTYADAIVDQAKRRALINLTASANQALKTGAETGETIEEMERGLVEVVRGGGEKSAWRSVASVVDAAIKQGMESKGIPGVSTGLKDLDEATGGLRKGQLIIVAGRPSMGKSTGALQLAKAVAQTGKGVAFYSMEMPAFDLGLRVACDVAFDPYAPFFSGRSMNPNYFDASRGKLESAQWQALHGAADRVRDLPLDFDPRAGLTVPQMLKAARRRFRAWEREGVEPGLVVLDHLTIARPDQDRKGNKVAEVGDISRGLAEMAKTLDIPVLALCQLSRDVEKRGEKERRPTLADLRWSGEIEQDARLVMFLYRPEYYARRPEDRDDFEANASWKAKLDKVKHKLFWLIEKNNNGPTGEVETYCDIACSAIRDRLELGGHL